MSAPVKQRRLGSDRPLSGGLRGPALSPPPEKEERSLDWILWVLLSPLLLLILTWVLGRTVEPVRAQVVKIPLAGPLLFSEPVWRPFGQGEQGADPGQGPESPEPGTEPVVGDPNDLPADYANLNAEIVARLAAVEAREAFVREKEEALREQEQAMDELQRQVSRSSAEVEALRTQLQGQLRTELDRVAVIRGMKSAAQVQLFGAMTDDEAVAVLKYMEPDEVGKVLASMDPWRSARILHRLTQVGAGQ